VPVSVDGVCGVAAGGVAGAIGSGAGCVIGGFVDAVVLESTPAVPPHCIQAKAAMRTTAATAIQAPQFPRPLGRVRRSSSLFLLGSKDMIFPPR